MQHEEEIRVPNPSRSQEPGTPPVLGNTGDKKEPGGAHYDAARSSQTVAAQMAGDDAKHLVHKVFEVGHATRSDPSTTVTALQHNLQQPVGRVCCFAVCCTCQEACRLSLGFKYFCLLAMMAVYGPVTGPAV